MLVKSSKGKQASKLSLFIACLVVDMRMTYSDHQLL